MLDDSRFPSTIYRYGASDVATPVLRGTGLRVQTLVIDINQTGMTPAQVAVEYDLPEARVVEALAFYALRIGPRSTRTSTLKARWARRMARPRLHLDVDTSKKSLHKALMERGHDVTRTPNEWGPAGTVDRRARRGHDALPDADRPPSVPRICLKVRFLHLL